jgi:hypothetical protein
MARVKSNLQSVKVGLTAVAGALDPTRKIPGGRRLGDEIAEVMASGIRERTVTRQLDADGNRLAKLSRRTLIEKARRGQPETILVATGDMLSLPQIMGVPHVNSKSVTIFPGLDEEDRLKVQYAEDGSDNRPERHFIGIDRETEADIDAVNEEALAKTIRING